MSDNMSKNLKQNLKQNIISSPKTDLRRKEDYFDSFSFNRYSIQSCLIVFFVTTILVLAIISIAISPNPNILFGV